MHTHHDLDAVILTATMLSSKRRPAQRAAAVADSLAAWRARAGHPPLLLEPQELGAAVHAYKATRKTAGKNLLMPEPQATRHFKVEGRWRRVVKTR